MRDLNYKPYFCEGESAVKQYQDYHSHNTEQLDVEGVKNLLLTLPEIQAELESLGGMR
jgi:UDP-glucose 4-epimerase